MSNKENCKNVKINSKINLRLPTGKKKTLKDIDFDEDKLKKLFATQEKKKRHYDYDYYFDETDMENEVEQTNNEDSNDEVVIKKKKTLKRKIQQHLLPKNRRKNKKVSWTL